MRKALALSFLLFLSAPFIFAVPARAAFKQVGFSGEFSAEDISALAVDADGRIFAADENGMITVFSPDGKAGLKWGGKDKEGRWELDEPSGLALYGDRVYVTDSSENKVLIFSKDGRFIEGFGVGGSAAKEFGGPAGIAVSGGVMYVADPGNRRVQIFGPDGVYIGSIAGSAETPLEKPIGVSLDYSGNVYVLDAGLKAVRIYRPSGKLIKSVTGLDEPVSISMEDGGFFVADRGDNKIKKFGPKGELLFSFGVEGKGRGQFRKLSGVSASGGKVYAADSKKDTVQVFSPERAEAAPFEKAPPPTAVKWLGDIGLENAGKLYWDGKGRLYVIDTKKEAIVVVKDGGVEKTLKLKGVVPTAAVKDREGFLWVVERRKDRLLKLNEDGDVLLSTGSSGAKEGYLSDPSDIAISKKGFIYVADRGNGRVQIFNKDGMFVAVIGGEESRPPVERPTAIALDRADNLYVLDREKIEVVKFSPEGKLLASFGKRGSGKGDFERPEDIAIANDEVFVLDRALNNIQVLSPDGKFLREFGSRGNGKGDFKEPSAIFLKDDIEVFVSDPGNKRVQALGIIYTPEPPARVRAEGGMREIRVRWEMGGEDYVENYTVYRSEKSTGGFEPVGTTQMNIFKDSGVLPDRAYFFRVSATARGGNESSKSGVSDAKATKYITAEPADLDAVSSDRDITLNWRPNAEDFLSHYSVYKEVDGAFKFLGKTEGPKFFDRAVKPNREYRYRVTSSSSDGVESRAAEIKVSTLKETKPPLEVSPLGLQNIFSNTYKLYEAEGIGKIRVTNNTWDRIAKLKLSFTIKEFMDFPTEVDIDNIGPRESVDVVVKPVFNNRILSVTENTPVQMEVKASYYENQKPRSYTNNYTLQLYEKHYLTWDVRDRIGTFVTPKDAPVLEFAREVARQYRDMQDPIIYARGVFDALGLIGMAYLPDPTNPYQVTSEKTDLVDYVQYPQETLRRKSGDCDDLVNLYSASLESLGVRTMLVDTPGHIFMMFSTGVSAVDKDDDMYVAHDGVLWVPVEVTMVGSSFLKAWKKGVETYREWHGKGLEKVDLKKAWERFKPASLPALEWRAERVTRDAIEAKYPDELDYLRKLRVKRLSRPYLAALEKNPKNPDARVKLGIIYGESGESKEALRHFNKVLSLDPKNTAAKNNTGNIYFLQGRFEDARKAYEEALALEPADADMWTNLSRCYLRLGMRAEAGSAYEKAVKLNKEIPKKYLDLALELDKSGGLPGAK